MIINGSAILKKTKNFALYYRACVLINRCIEEAISKLNAVAKEKPKADALL